VFTIPPQESYRIDGPSRQNIFFSGFNRKIASLVAHAGPLDHIPPVKLTFIYFYMDQEINSGGGWSISAGERWSGPPVFAGKMDIFIFFYRS
jgi:hypothetical protein